MKVTNAKRTQKLTLYSIAQERKFETKKNRNEKMEKIRNLELTKNYKTSYN